MTDLYHGRNLSKLKGTLGNYLTYNDAIQLERRLIREWAGVRRRW